MSRIFMSHSSRDNFAAVALGDWLTEEGWDDVFLDLDPAQGIHPGQRWERALYEHAAECEAVLFLVSRNWLASDWCRREYELAHKLNKRIFVVLIEAIAIDELPQYLKETLQAVQLGAGEDHRIFQPKMPITQEEGYVTFSREGLARLKAGLTQAGLDPRFFVWPPQDEPNRAPYRGLEPLDAKDAGVFFGREAPIIEAFDALRGLREAACPRFFIIQAASGAGKSSFLRAGLLPRLERDERNFLPLSPIRPERAAIMGSNGFIASLATAMAKAGLTTTRAEIREAALAGGEALRPILRNLAARRDAKPMLIFSVDQAEELFRAEGAAEGERLLTLLRDLTSSDDPAAIALFSIRLDSLDKLVQVEALEGRRPRAFMLVPMPHGAYETVIEGPAQRVRQAGRKFEIDPRLTQALLEDIEKDGGSDALPLLSFALEQFYRDNEAAGRISREDYQKFGGLKGVIDASLERVFAEADKDARIPKDEAGRLVLLRRGFIPWLAGVDPETKTPRRRVARAAQIPLEARLLIDLLVEHRLLTRDVDRTGETTIEPAHESLLRQWSRLKGWLDEDFGLLAVLEGVKRAAGDWKRSHFSEAWLAHGGQRLAEAQALDGRPDIAARLDAVDRAYLSQCQAKEEAARVEAETRRREREEAQARRLADAEALAAANKVTTQRTLIGAAVAVIFALGAAIFGAYAMREKTIADVSTQRAKATGEDAADMARLARTTLAETNDTLGHRLEDLENWTPPAWRVRLHGWRAHKYATAGDFPAQRGEIDLALREEPGSVPLLITSSDNFVVSGEADAAVRDATKALQAGATDALVYGNLVLGEAMRRDYSQAIAHIEEALKKQRTIWDTESLRAPEVQELAGGFQLRVDDTDYLLALRYEKAALLAMSGDGRFSDALAEADCADRDRPFSRTAYLAALNWEWLIVRGQAMRDVREAQAGGVDASATTKPPIRDYGAYAAEGALWARIAATRPDFEPRARNAFAKFRETHKAAPREDYRGIAAWVEEVAEKPIERKIEPDSPLEAARDLEVRARELHYGPNSGNEPFRMVPALALLSDAIHLLDPQRLGRPLGRREEDGLIDLLLLRGDWRLSTHGPLGDNSGDKGGAAQDARRVLEIDDNIADAHRLLGAALTASADKLREYKRAIELDPSNPDALDGLASMADPREALNHIERKHVFTRFFYADDFAKLASLQDRVGMSADALRSIAMAIELAPWELSFRSAKRDYEIHAKVESDLADLHYAQGVHETADYSARTGRDDEALRAYTEAFRTATAQSDNAATTLEIESLAKDFSAFLIRRFGRTEAEQWWRSFATNPLASKREKQLSAREAQRVAAER